MRTKLWSSIGVLASIAASVGVAGAADLATKPVYTKAPPPPVILSDWAGLYLGVHAGGGWGDMTLTDLNGEGSKVKPSGGLGGGHVGYNWQFGQVVAGLEGDFDGAAIKGTDTFGVATAKTDELASIRGRLGYAFLPNLLAYGTGGVGFGHTHFDFFQGLIPSESIWQTGWVAGAGLEYKVTGNWIARGEYLHYGFDNGSTTVLSTVKNDINVIRGGVSYKF